MDKEKDIPLASRSARRSALGKRTEDVRGKVSYPIREALNRDIAAGVLGDTESAVVDAILTSYYLGRSAMDKLHEERMNLLFGSGQE